MKKSDAAMRYLYEFYCQSKSTRASERISGPDFSREIERDLWIGFVAGGFRLEIEINPRYGAFDSKLTCCCKDKRAVFMFHDATGDICGYYLNQSLPQDPAWEIDQVKWKNWAACQDFEEVLEIVQWYIEGRNLNEHPNFEISKD